MDDKGRCKLLGGGTSLLVCTRRLGGAVCAQPLHSKRPAAGHVQGGLSAPGPTPQAFSLALNWRPTLGLGSQTHVTLGDPYGFEQGVAQ